MGGGWGDRKRDQRGPTNHREVKKAIQIKRERRGRKIEEKVWKQRGTKKKTQKEKSWKGGQK